MAQLQIEGGASAPKKSIGKVILIVIIIIVAVIIFFIANPAKSKDVPLPSYLNNGGSGGSNTPTPSKSPTTTTTNTASGRNTPTTTGLVGCQSNWTSKPAFTLDLQKFLNIKNSAKIAEDGSYGSGTATAVDNYLAKFKRTAEQLACDVWAWKSGGSSTSTASATGFSPGYNSSLAAADAKKIYMNLYHAPIGGSDENMIVSLFVGKNKYDVDVLKYQYNNINLSDGSKINLYDDLNANLHTENYAKIKSLLF